jgi:acetyl-CoA C-acetyltransferase
MTKAQIVGWAHSALGKSELENAGQLMATAAAPTLADGDVDAIFVYVSLLERAK